MLLYLANTDQLSKPPKRRKGRGRARRALHNNLWVLPHACTLANGFLGFAGIVAGFQGKYNLALTCIFLSAIFDAMDGKIARLTGLSSPLGVQLDSLCDAISFCCAPAFLVYTSQLQQLGLLGLLCAGSFLLAGIVRLARFNLISHTETSYFTGLPTPAAACVLLYTSFALQLSPWLVAATCIGLSSLMVSCIPFWSGKKIHWSTLCALCIVYGSGVFICNTRIITLLYIGAYLMYNLLGYLRMRYHAALSR